jgi:hypothetical protein
MFLLVPFEFRPASQAKPTVQTTDAVNEARRKLHETGAFHQERCMRKTGFKQKAKLPETTNEKASSPQPHDHYD